MAAQKESLMPYLSDFDQLAWAREAELTSGAGRGNRVIDVDNGSGLRFTVSPDRGMDIVEASFRGIPLVFRTPGGNRSRMEYDPVGLGWLRTWQGGLMTTCGLRTAGNPDQDFGLHGRIDNLPAEDVAVVRGWNEEGSRYGIEVHGKLREAAMFFENLRLQRTISTAYGENKIHVRDIVSNCGSEDDYIQIVYHCNFGFPFVSPDLKFILPEHDVIPRNEDAAKDLANWNVMPEPDPQNPPEECFFHNLPEGEDGYACFRMENKSLGIAASLRYFTATLPRIVQWKLFQKNRYVLGVEPTNTMLNGRMNDIRNGKAQILHPGENIAFDLEFVFESI